MLRGIENRLMLDEIRGDPSVEKLKKTCLDFESIFISYMLKSMRSSFAEGGFLEKSHGSRLIKSMFDENLAMGIAKDGGIGMGEILYQQLKDKY